MFVIMKVKCDINGEGGDDDDEVGMMAMLANHAILLSFSLLMYMY